MAQQKTTSANDESTSVQEDPNGLVYAGAVLTGAGKAVQKTAQELQESVQKSYEPGDMRIEHAPHPVDNLANGVSRLVTPGDMNPAHAPHPVDQAAVVAGKAMEAAEQKLAQIKAAGPVEGSLLASEAITGAVVGQITPGKNIRMAEHLLDEAGKAGKSVQGLEGHLVDADHMPADKSLAAKIQQDLADVPSEPKARLQRAKEALLSPFQTVIDTITPPDAATRLNRTVYDGKPGMMDNLNGNAQLLNDEHALRFARAQQITEAIQNPAVPAELRQRLDKAIAGLNQDQLKALLQSDRYDDMLGIQKGPRQLQQQTPFPGEDKLVTGFTSPGEVKPKTVLDEIQKYILPQNASKQTMEQFASELEQGNFGNALKMQAESVAKGWAGLAGGSAIAAGAVVHHMNAEKEEKLAQLPANERLAQTFEATAGNAKLEKEHPELKAAYAEYHQQVDAALKRHPSNEGRTSNEASSEIFRARQEIIRDLKNHGLENTEQRSSIDHLSPEQKVAAAAQFIQTLPEHQRGPYQERVAEYANKAGLSVAETHHEIDRSAERTA